MKIDEIDKLILRELSTNGRQSIRELAKQINLSAPSVTERVRRLESEGIIKGYTIDIDYKKLGYNVECFIEITLRHGEYHKFQTDIVKHPNVEFCYRIAGQSCYIIKLRLQSLTDIERFINEVTSYAGTVTHIALSKVELNNRLLEHL